MPTYNTFLKIDRNSGCCNYEKVNYLYQNEFIVLIAYYMYLKISKTIMHADKMNIEDKVNIMHQTCHRVADRLTCYNTENLTLHHNCCRVWIVPRPLHAQDYLCSVVFGRSLLVLLTFFFWPLYLILFFIT